jgi:hypothetical protein
MRPVLGGLFSRSFRRIAFAGCCRRVGGTRPKFRTLKQLKNWRETVRQVRDFDRPIEGRALSVKMFLTLLGWKDFGGKLIDFVMNTCDVRIHFFGIEFLSNYPHRSVISST